MGPLGVISIQLGPKDGNRLVGLGLRRRGRKREEKLSEDMVKSNHLQARKRALIRNQISPDLGLPSLWFCEK